MVKTTTSSPGSPIAARSLLRGEPAAQENRSVVRDMSRTDYSTPPPEFYIDPSTLKTEEQLIEFLKSFDQWHSKWWIQYAGKYGSDGVLAIPPTGKPVRTIVVSATNPDDVFIVERMEAADFITLTRENKIRVAGTAAFDDVKASFGFERTADARFDGLSIDDYLDQVVDDMRANRGRMSDADLQPYLDQIEHLRAGINEQGIVKPAAISKNVQDIKDAFQRAAHFSDITPQTYGPEGPNGHYTNVISLDDGAAVNSGYRTLVECDRQIAAAEARLAALLEGGGNIDPYRLIMEVMLLNQSMADAKARRETVELEQQSELSATYTAMQNAVNETLRLFGGDKEDETKRVTLFGKTSYGDLTDRQKKLASMFSSLFGQDAQRHPLETARSIERPLMNIVEDRDGNPLVAFTNAQWNTYGTQLSEVSTLLSQNTQLKMNDIATLRDQSTTLFEAASKAVTRMSELISTISRGTS